MKKLFALTVLLFLCIILNIACNKIRAKIENRFNNCFLVNTSSTKKYRFTVKKTEIQDNHIYKYSTQLIDLNPGDEMYLGEKSYETEIQYPIKEKQVIVSHKPLTKEERKREIENYKSGKYKHDIKYFVMPELKKYGITSAFDPDPDPDTVINGDTLKYHFETKQYRDVVHPIPVKHFVCNYDVTGQIELKEKQ